MSELGRQSQLREQDAEARLRAQRSFEGSMLIEAGAGTGKTTTLVARVVIWALGPGWEKSEARLEESAQDESRGERDQRVAADLLSRVVSITFTEAAAAEMSERVGALLGSVARGELPDWLDLEQLPADASLRSQRAMALLGALDHLVVRTIHAWCRRLLAQYPFEAGVHPDFQVDADERLQLEVVREVLEEALERDDDHPVVRYLSELAVQGFGAGRVEEALRSLLAEGASADSLDFEPLSPARVAAHLAALAAALSDFQRDTGAKLSGVHKRSKATLQALDALHGLAGRLQEPPLEGVSALAEWLVSLRDLVSDKPLERISDWAKGRFNKSELAALEEEPGDAKRDAEELTLLLHPLLALDPGRLEAGRRALLGLLIEVEKRLRSRGIATFASLLGGARNLLVNNAEIRARVRADLDQLLVDEFQDTDLTQCEIIRRLALEGPEVQRPGLFLVGDPKQSIYGWRNADLRAYDDFRREIEAAGGECHSLSVNFRSVPAILEEVERALAPVMLREEGLQPAFEPLAVCPRLEGEPGFTAEGHAPVEYWVSWQWDPERAVPDHNTRSVQAASLEARALARELRSLHDRHDVVWGEMAVLFRGVGDLEIYLSELRALGVPYAVERDRSYYRRREVIEAAALVRCVLDPKDTLALLTLLRSASVGVPDAALLPLWLRSFPAGVSRLYGVSSVGLAPLEAMVREVAAELTVDLSPGLERLGGWENNLLAALESIAVLRESFDHEPVDLFVERLRSLFLLELTEAARHLGSFRLANLQRLFRQLRADLAAGSDPQEVLRRLRSDVATGRFAEEERPALESHEAVRIMTIHKAKGLDFEHVYLVQLHKGGSGGSGDRAELERGSAGEELHVFKTSSLGFGEVERRQRAVEAAERVRALYVAMTRAKRRLVMLGRWPELPEPRAFAEAKSSLELLASRQGLPEELGRWMIEAAEAQAADRRDEWGVLWRFPALEERPGIAGRAAASRPGEGRRSERGRVSVRHAEEDSQRLSALAALAGRRMDRTWGAAASQLARAWQREERSLHMQGLGPPIGAHVAAPRATSEAPASAESSLDVSLVATAAGTAVHRVLEEFDLGASPDEELDRLRQELPGYLAHVAPAREREAALERALELLERFAGGPLFERFCALKDQLVARELPVWLPPSALHEGALLASAEAGAGEESDGGGAEGGPLAFVAGAIDLLYRDVEGSASRPEGSGAGAGEWVVADYKTDRVEGARELEERAAHYRLQGEAYVRAVQGALELPEPPRFELWFLFAGVALRVPLTRD